MPNIYSGSSGKRYKTNFKIENFFEEVSKALLAIVKPDYQLIVFGPGETKKKFVNFLTKTQIGKDHEIKIVEGVDSSGEDGIHIFTKSKSMKDIISNSKLAKVSDIIDQVMILANRKSSKFTMGFEETKKANEYSAIDSLIFSEKAIQSNDAVVGGQPMRKGFAATGPPCRSTRRPSAATPWTTICDGPTCTTRRARRRRS